MLKQQSRTALLDRAIGELGDFQARIHLDRNALQLMVLFQRADELAQILIGHNLSVWQ